MALPKLFQRIFWHNNTTPAINEDNLNSMSKAIDDIDDRVIELGSDVMEKIPQIQGYLDQADELVDQITELTTNPPYIGSNGNWYVWNTSTGAYVDSGVDASITLTIADVTMLNAGESPRVTNTGTNTDPIFHLFIPMAIADLRYTQKGTAIKFPLVNYTFGVRYTINLTLNIDGDTATTSIYNVALGDSRVISISGKPLIFVSINDTVVIEDNSKKGVLNVFAPTDTSVTVTVDSVIANYTIPIRTYTTEILTSGSTTVTFTGIPTSGNYAIDFFTSTGINYTAISESSGSVTLTFDAQQTDVTVTCRIEEIS